MNNPGSHANGMTWGIHYWPIALIVVSVTAALAFFPAELYAVFTNHNNTLSDYARYNLDLTTAFGQRTKIHTVAWWATLTAWLFLIGGLYVWLTGHIWFVKWG